MVCRWCEDSTLNHSGTTGRGELSNEYVQFTLIRSSAWKGNLKRYFSPVHLLLSVNSRHFFLGGTHWQEIDPAQSFPGAVRDLPLFSVGTHAYLAINESRYVRDDLSLTRRRRCSRGMVAVIGLPAVTGRCSFAKYFPDRAD